MDFEGILKSPLRATDAETMELVESLLHDETFELDEVVDDRANGVVVIPVRRQFHDGPERVLKSGCAWTVYEKDWMRSELIIRRVESWRVEEDQGINTYTFCSWRVAARRLVAECNEVMKLIFEAGGIDVELRDLGFRGKARVKRGPLGVQLLSGEIYD